MNIYIYVSFCLFSEYSETSLQNAIGCKNLDVPFEEWPLRNMGSPIYATAAMECSKQTYHNLSDIVDMFASDQQYWSVRFMEAWDIMATNGYTDLKEGPKAGWFGYYSLQKQGRLDLDQLVVEMVNGGIIWTDPLVSRYKGVTSVEEQRIWKGRSITPLLKNQKLKVDAQDKFQ